MPIDASIALQGQPLQIDSPVNAMSAVQGLINARTQNQLAQQQLLSQKNEMERQNALRQALSGVDPTTPEGRTTIQQTYMRAGDAKGALEFASNAAKLDKDARDSALADIKLRQEKTAAVSQTAASLFAKPDLSFDDVKTAEADLTKKGYLTPEESQAQLAQWQADPAFAQNPTQFLRSKLGQLAQQGMSVHDTLEQHKLSFQNVGDRTVGLDPITGAEVSSTKRGQSPDAFARIASNPLLQAHPLTAQAIIDGRIPVGKATIRTAPLYEEALKIDPNADLTALNNSQLGEQAGARAAGTTQANISIASDEARRMIGVARGLAANLNTGEFPSLNAIENAVSKGTGDVNVVKLNTALNALVNSYARAISPRGTPTVSDKNHARDIVNSALSKGQIGSAFDVMEQEMTASNAAATGGLKSKPHGKAAATAADSGNWKDL